MEDYKSPILCVIYRILAMLVFVVGILAGVVEMASATAIAPSGAALGGVAGFLTIGTALIAAIFLYGVAEVIDLIGRAAYNCACTAQEAKASRLLLAEIKNAQKASPGSSIPPDLLEEMVKDIKGLRQQLDNIEAGPLAQLNWLPHIAQRQDP